LTSRHLTMSTEPAFRLMRLPARLQKKCHAFSAFTS
jgi:hypothetical protein